MHRAKPKESRAEASGIGVAGNGGMQQKPHRHGAVMQKGAMNFGGVRRQAAHSERRG